MGDSRHNRGDGAVYIYQRLENGSFSTTPTSFIGENVNQLGYGIAISGNRLAYGVPRNSTTKGEVRTYTFTGDSNADGKIDAWELEATITAPNGRTGDSFGQSLDLEGDVMAIGAPLNDGGAERTITSTIDPRAEDYINNSGAVYLYRLNMDRENEDEPLWKYSAYLKAVDASDDDEFGKVVRLQSDGTVVASALKGEASGRSKRHNSGAVYIYR